MGVPPIMAKTPKDYVEGVMEWLEALEVPITKTLEREEFRDYISTKLTAVTGEGREHQFSALWEAVSVKWDKMLPRGIRPYVYEFKTGKQIRFGIKGFRGAFGFAGLYEKTGFDPVAEW